MESSGDADEVRHFNLLHLFAFGTCSVYRSNLGLYGPLNDRQEQKLRQLSLVSLCARHKDLTYDDIEDELQVSDDRLVEDLLVRCIYDGVIAGKIDAANRSFKVDWVSARDVSNEDIEEISKVLSRWMERANVLANVIGNKIDEARGSLEQSRMDARMRENQIKELTEKLKQMVTDTADGAGRSQRRDFRGGGGKGKKRGGPFESDEQ